MIFVISLILSTSYKVRLKDDSYDVYGTTTKVYAVLQWTFCWYTCTVLYYYYESIIAKMLL